MPAEEFIANPYKPNDPRHAAIEARRRREQHAAVHGRFADASRLRTADYAVAQSNAPRSVVAGLDQAAPSVSHGASTSHGAAGGVVSRSLEAPGADGSKSPRAARTRAPRAEVQFEAPVGGADATTVTALCGGTALWVGHRDGTVSVHSGADGAELSRFVAGRTAEPPVPFHRDIIKAVSAAAAAAAAGEAAEGSADSGEAAADSGAEQRTATQPPPAPAAADGGRRAPVSAMLPVAGCSLMAVGRGDGGLAVFDALTHNSVHSWTPGDDDNSDGDAAAGQPPQKTPAAAHAAVNFLLPFVVESAGDADAAFVAVSREGLAAWSVRLPTPEEEMERDQRRAEAARTKRRDDEAAAEAALLPTVRRLAFRAVPQKLGRVTSAAAVGNVLYIGTDKGAVHEVDAGDLGIGPALCTVNGGGAARPMAASGAHLFVGHGREMSVFARIGASGGKMASPGDLKRRPVAVLFRGADSTGAELAHAAYEPRSNRLWVADSAGAVVEVDASPLTGFPRRLAAGSAATRPPAVPDQGESAEGDEDPAAARRRSVAQQQSRGPVPVAALELFAHADAAHMWTAASNGRNVAWWTEYRKGHDEAADALEEMKATAGRDAAGVSDVDAKITREMSAYAARRAHCADGSAKQVGRTLALRYFLAWLRLRLRRQYLKRRAALAATLAARNESIVSRRCYVVWLAFRRERRAVCLLSNAAAMLLRENEAQARRSWLRKLEALVADRRRHRVARQRSESLEGAERRQVAEMWYGRWQRFGGNAHLHRNSSKLSAALEERTDAATRAAVFSKWMRFDAEQSRTRTAAAATVAVLTSNQTAAIQAAYDRLRGHVSARKAERARTGWAVKMEKEVQVQLRASFFSKFWRFCGMRRRAAREAEGQELAAEYRRLDAEAEGELKPRLDRLKQLHALQEQIAAAKEEAAAVELRVERATAAADAAEADLAAAEGADREELLTTALEPLPAPRAAFVVAAGGLLQRAVSLLKDSPVLTRAAADPQQGAAAQFASALAAAKKVAAGFARGDEETAPVRAAGAAAADKPVELWPVPVDPQMLAEAALRHRGAEGAQLVAATKALAVAAIGLSNSQIDAMPAEQRNEFVANAGRLGSLAEFLARPARSLEASLRSPPGTPRGHDGGARGAAPAAAAGTGRRRLATRSSSPGRRGATPKAGVRSAASLRAASPKKRTASPKQRTASPKKRTASPKQRTASPKKRTSSPKAGGTRRTSSPKAGGTRRTSSPKAGGTGRRTASPKTGVRRTASPKAGGAKTSTKPRVPLASRV